VVDRSFGLLQRLPFEGVGHSKSAVEHRVNAIQLLQRVGDPLA
jgi:hypothetical protein